MSKRNIKHQKGKQLYLNQIFYKGMLYTSSEMQEGFAKIIDNYDIAPTGDAASPRKPFILYNDINDALGPDSNYIFPCQFQQFVGKQAYVKFTRTISEKEFAEDDLTNLPETPDKTVSVVLRDSNMFNDSNLGLEEQEYYVEETENETVSDLLIDDALWINTVTNNAGSFVFDTSENTIQIKDYQYDAQETNHYSDNYINSISHEITFEDIAQGNNTDFYFENNKAYIFDKTVNGSTVKVFNINYDEDVSFFECLLIMDFTANNGQSFNKLKITAERTSLIALSINTIKIYYGDSSNNFTEVFSKTGSTGNGTWSDYNAYGSIYVTNAPYLFENPVYDTHINSIHEYGNSSLSLKNVLYPFYNKFTPTDISKLSPIDGDTFDYDSTRYRLWIADTTELGYKWSIYGTYFLQNLLKSAINNNLCYQFISKNISGNRQVVDINLYSVFNNNIYKYNVSEILLRSGLAMIRYTDINQIGETLFNLYNSYQQQAEEDQRHRWSDSDIDPLWESQEYQINPNPKDTTMHITNDMLIEVVKLEDEYTISAKSKVKLNCVKPVYINYLDAVGFIGRIIKYNNNATTIVYKGLILLQAQQDNDGDPYFKILLPRNNGQGFKPDIADAAINGYNLYNSELIHIENTDNIESPENALTIKGLALLNTTIDNNERVLTDPVELVQQGVLGQTIQLKPVINEGYYVRGVPATTDTFGYELKFSNITATCTYTDPENNNAQSTLSASPSSTTMSIKKARTDSSYVSVYDYDLFYDLEDDYNVWKKDYDTISDIYVNVTVDSIDIIKPDNSIITIDLTSQNTGSNKISFASRIDTQGIKKSIILSNLDGFLLEVCLKYETTIVDNRIVKLTIYAYNNFSNPFKTIDENFVLEDRSGFNPAINIYSQWLVAAYDSQDFMELQPEQLLYTINPNAVLLNRESNITPEILNYTINRSGRLNFKFILKPKIKIHSDSNPSGPFADIYLENEFANMYLVSQALVVGNDIITISTEDLIKNIDTKNATRLCLYNDQLGLYGPYTKSDIILFSKFQTYDYFPYPNASINLTEPIIWISNYKDALVIFGRQSIFMLNSQTIITDGKYNKVYENMSIRLPDINSIIPVGNNLIFFNNGTGYVIVPNTYVDNSNNIKLYKLTEAISNFFYNPDDYMRLRLKNLNPITNYTYDLEFISYAQNNNIDIAVNVKVTNGQSLSLLFIYNQDYKYWRMYSTQLFDKFTNIYICEPNLNNQYIVLKDNQYKIVYINNNTQVFNYMDKVIPETTATERIPIVTMLHSGYLSVDTMNDKRFKDVIIELDNIKEQSTLDIDFQFFVDSKPIVIPSDDILIVDKTNNSTNPASGLETDYTYSDIEDRQYHGMYLNGSSQDKNNYGTAFKIDSNVYTISGRTHIRIPVFGKGRLPSFIMEISANNFYEFINYALIYKEKDINRRS